MGYLCVSGPHVDLLFGKVALLGWHRRAQVHTNVLRNVEIGPALIVIHFFN